MTGKPMLLSECGGHAQDAKFYAWRPLYASSGVEVKSARKWPKDATTRWKVPWMERLIEAHADQPAPNARTSANTDAHRAASPLQSMHPHPAGCAQSLCSPGACGSCAG